MATTKKPAAKIAAPARPKVVATSTAEGVATYWVTSNLRIDGLKLQFGDTVELTEQQAASLEGFVELVDAATTATEAPPA